jgi:hypothetical protein
MLSATLLQWTDTASSWRISCYDEGDGVLDFSGKSLTSGSKTLSDMCEALSNTIAERLNQAAHEKALRR